MPTIDLVALAKWLMKPKSWLYMLLLIFLVWGGFQAYQFVYDRGASSRDKEVARLTEERNEAVTNYTEYKSEYENWVRNTRDAQAQFMREQAVLIADLTKSLAEAEKRAREKPVTIKEVIRYVPAEVDARYPLPLGFVRLYADSLQRPASSATGGFDLPGGYTFDVGEASPLALSQFGLIASGNNAECVLRGEVIDAWQTWYEGAKADFERRNQTLVDDAPAKR